MDLNFSGLKTTRVYQRDIKKLTSDSSFRHSSQLKTDNFFTFDPLLISKIRPPFPQTPTMITIS